VACVIGDSEAETGPLSTTWHSNKFLNPVRNVAVLPILHLNGYKIANPTVLARICRGELEYLMKGYGSSLILLKAQSRKLCISWWRRRSIPVFHSSSDLPAHESQGFSRARRQGRRNDDDSF